MCVGGGGWVGSVLLYVICSGKSCVAGIRHSGCFRTPGGGQAGHTQNVGSPGRFGTCHGALRGRGPSFGPTVGTQARSEATKRRRALGAQPAAVGGPLTSVADGRRAVVSAGSAPFWRHGQHCRCPLPGMHQKGRGLRGGPRSG